MNEEVRIDLNIKENLGWIYFILPYLSPIKNKVGLILSILFGCSKCKLKLKNGGEVTFSKSKFQTMMSLLGALTFCTSYKIDEKENLEIILDMKNKFHVNLNKLSFEDENILELLFDAVRFGADFVTNNNSAIIRDKQFRIFEKNGRKVIETKNGIKFYIDSIHAGNTIVETFVNKIHLIDSNTNWNNKIVVDVGAECGDTALFYGSLGATVYAFEPIKAHFDAMKQNLGLNPDISHRIIPINIAIGKDEMLRFYQSPSAKIGESASFVYNTYGNKAKITTVKGLTLEKALKEYKIDHVDLLKMDCKGCEFFLNDESLEKVDSLKIEYNTKVGNYKLEDLISLLKNGNFDYVLYKHMASDRLSNKNRGTVFAKKSI